MTEVMETDYFCRVCGDIVKAADAKQHPCKEEEQIKEGFVLNV